MQVIVELRSCTIWLTIVHYSQIQINVSLMQLSMNNRFICHLRYAFMVTVVFLSVARINMGILG